MTFAPRLNFHAPLTSDASVGVESTPQAVPFQNMPVRPHFTCTITPFTPDMESEDMPWKYPSQFEGLKMPCVITMHCGGVAS